MRRSILLWAVFGMAALGLATPAAVAQDQPAKEVALARTYKVGQVTRYKERITFTLAGMEGDMTMTSKTTTKEIAKNGDATMITVVESGKISMNGQEQDLPQTPESSEVRSKLNRLVKETHTEQQQSPIAPELQRLMASCADVLFPEKPVKPGDTWQTELDNPVIKDKKVLVKSTYVGTEKVGDIECWKVKQTAEAVTAADGSKTTFDGTYWLSPADGQTMKVDGTVTNLPSQFGAMTFKIAMNQVKQGAAPADK